MTVAVAPKADARTKVREITRQAFREARRSLGLRLAEVAESAGITEGGLSHFETGRNGLTAEVLDLIADRINSEYRSLQKLATEMADRDQGLPVRLLALGLSDKATRDDSCAYTDKLAADITVNGSPESARSIPNLDRRRVTPENAERIAARAREIKRDWVVRLEKLQSTVQDSVITEIIASFRREIANLERQLRAAKRRKK